MAGHRMERLNNDVMRELPAIIRTLKDPRVDGLLSIVRVDITSDLSYATIHVSSMDDVERTAEAVEGLNSAAGVIRTGIAKVVAMRKSPEFKFVADDSIAYSAELDAKLRRLNKEE